MERDALRLAGADHHWLHRDLEITDFDRSVRVNLGGYAAAKHGIVGLTRSAALDYAGRNIRVNAVAPGPILTHRISALSEDQRAPIVRTVPPGRMGDPDDVAATVAWLCSDLAKFVTGITVPIDGGRLIQGGGRLGD